MDVMLLAWLCWCAANVVIWLVSPWLVPGNVPAFTNGIVIVIRPLLMTHLTEAEVAAVRAHEEGHVAHRHAAWNMVCSCLLFPPSKSALARQEMEADDYAARQVGPSVVASAMRKLGGGTAARLHRLGA